MKLVTLLVPVASALALGERGTIMRKLLGATMFALVMATTLATSAEAAPPSIVPISAGVFHTCALTPGKGVQCWGAGGDGALGNGTFNDSSVPVNVTGLSSGVAAIAAGWYHTCALTTSGGVKCWGDNSGGQLGDGTNIVHNVPIDVTGLSSGVMAISGGGFHTCALMTSGDLKCWGANGYGQLGVGTTTPSNVPVDVMGGVATVAAAYYHTCAVTTAARPMCWGYNFYGQLGDGTNIDRVSPVQVTVPSNNAVAITAGESHTCMLTTSGGVQCWGDNGYGELGDGTSNRSNVPVIVAGLSSGVAAISSHGIHTCALTTGGGVKCWGDDFDGQLGDAAATFTGLPVDVDGLSSGVASIAAGYYHSCALMTDGSAKCWGRNSHGQLGNNTTTRSNVPVSVLGTFISDFTRPVNDDFADAAILTSETGQETGTTFEATRETGEPTNCPDYAGSVWYRWTPDGNGIADLVAFPSACVAVYTGSSLGALTPVSNLITDPLNSRIRSAFVAVAGTTYHIAVAGDPGSPPASVTLGREFTPAPANDDFADAQVLTGITGSVGGTLAGASVQSGEPAPCAAGSGTVWYEWTAPQPGLLSLGVSAGISGSPCVSVYTGTSVDALSQVAAGAPTIGLSVLGGTTYRFVVTAWFSPTFTLGYLFIADESADALAGEGDSVTTDVEGDGATPIDPIEVTVTTPNAGSVSITESRTRFITFLGEFQIDIDLGLIADITAPPATPDDPLRITFIIDGSVLPISPIVWILVRQDGQRLWPCTGAPAAVPDPCLLSQAKVGDDTVVTVLTSHASTWTFETAAALSVRHVVVNDDGGTATCADFSFTVDGGSAMPVDADCERSITVAGGEYTVTQPAVAGYTTTYSDCSNIVIASPDTAICTITNDDQPVLYTFSGFFSPVDNPPVLNVVKGGQAIPVKFSLGGNLGLGIFAADYPKSQQITCDTGSPFDVIEETATAGDSSLSYDASTDRYVYVWKTNKAWAQTCRQLTIRLADGTEHVVLFKFM